MLNKSIIASGLIALSLGLTGCGGAAEGEQELSSLQKALETSINDMTNTYSEEEQQDINAQVMQMMLEISSFKDGLNASVDELVKIFLQNSINSSVNSLVENAVREGVEQALAAIQPIDTSEDTNNDVIDTIDTTDDTNDEIVQTPIETPTETPVAEESLVKLEWNAATEYTDGSSMPASDIAHYVLVYGNSSDDLSQSIEIDAGGIAAYDLEGLPAGDWVIGLKTVSVYGMESDVSNLVEVSI